VTPRRLWLGLLAYWLVAAVSLAVVHPERDEQWPSLVGLVVGAAAGAALVVALSGCRPRLPPAGLVPFVIVVSAVAEEAVWRRLVLGTLADRSGPMPALAASTVAFAVAHRSGRRVHVATGAVFGGLYVLSASLVCAASAHIVYNLALSGMVPSERTSEVGAAG
jgi:membrane protease YdiL (CAAX protease family)